MVVGVRFSLLLGLFLWLLAWPGQGALLPALIPPAPTLYRYHDDHDQRVLAQISATMVGSSSECQVQLTISATGPDVDPIPGWQGVRGANLFTAQQLGFILSGRVPVRFEVRSPGSVKSTVAQLSAGKVGPLPTRRVASDGRIDFLAQTQTPFPQQLLITIPPTSPGLYLGEMHVGGVSRLKILYLVGASAVEVLKVTSVPQPDLPAEKEAVPQKDPGVQQGKPDNEPPYRPPVTDRDWDVRDTEGKWALYQASQGRKSHWLKYLARRKDHAFLEELVLYGGMEDRQQAASNLAQVDAPQWIRAAVWLRHSSANFGHTEAKAQELLRKKAPVVVRAWLERYQDEVVRPRGLVEGDLKYLRHLALPRADSSKYLPPLKTAHIFRYLDAPHELGEFGQRHKAEPGRIYLEQVQRAIQAVVASGLYEEPWLGKTLALTRHPNLQVRQSAYLAYGNLGPGLDPRRLPLAEFRQVVADPQEPALAREAALLAYSYLLHPEVFLRLHELALQPEHPAWRATVSRLGDVGVGFSLAVLAKVPAEKVRALDAAVLRDTKQRLREREARWAEYFEGSAAGIWLERAAWAEQMKSPLHGELMKWTRATLATEAPVTIEPELVRLALDYVPAFPVAGGEESLQHRVRELARTILKLRQQQK